MIKVIKTIKEKVLQIWKKRKDTILKVLENQKKIQNKKELIEGYDNINPAQLNNY